MAGIVKRPGSFLKGRLVRLGIPLILFYFILGPVASVGHWHMPSSSTGITNPLTWKTYPHLLGMGPLWFAALLLIFDFGYAARRMSTGNRTCGLLKQSSPPGYLFIGVFIPGLAPVSHLLRMVIPMVKSVLGFPTLSYLPQYLSFFLLGAVASRQNRFRTLPNSMGLVGFVTAFVAGILLFPLGFSGHIFSVSQVMFPMSV